MRRQARLLALAVALLLGVPLAADQQLSPEATRLLEQLREMGRQAEQLLTPAPVLRTLAEVQAALDKGGVVDVAPGVELTGGRLVFRVTGTTLRGAGAILRGDKSGPALESLPDVDDVTVTDLDVYSAFPNVAILLGHNDNTQTTLARLPMRIALERVRLHDYQGKRCLEVNAAEFRLIDVQVGECWDPAGQDSQGLAILNTPGPGLIEGSYVGGSQIEGGSEVLLIGGDLVKIPGIIPSGITVRRTRLWRPLAWRGSTPSKRAKSIFEAKTGDRITVEDSVLEGCYRDAWSDCYGIVITPRSAGATTNMLFQRNIVRDVTSCIQMTGRDNVTQTPARTTGIVFREMGCTATPALLGGGRGLLAMLTMGVGTVEFDNVAFTGTGDHLIYVGDSERVERIRLVNSFATVGRYGIMGAGLANLAVPAPPALPWYESLEVTGNTFTGATAAFMRAAPNNRNIPRAEFDPLVASRLAR